MPSRWDEPRRPNEKPPGDDWVVVIVIAVLVLVVALALRGK